jgi:hypothetical protein
MCLHPRVQRLRGKAESQGVKSLALPALPDETSLNGQFWGRRVCYGSTVRNESMMAANSVNSFAPTTPCPLMAKVGVDWIPN